MFHVNAEVSHADFPIRKRLPLTTSNPNACPRFSTSMTFKEGLSVMAETRQRYGKTSRSYLRPEQLKDQRRQVFLNKVRQASDDKRWESRSDQILRQDFLWRQKEWEMEQATSAPPDPSSPEADQDEHFNHHDSEEIDMVDQIMSQEDEGCQALINLLNETNESLENVEPENPEENVSEFGNEAEDYDRLFTEVVMQQEQNQEQTLTLQERQISSPKIMEVAWDQNHQAQSPTLQRWHSSSPKAQEMDIS